MVRRNCQSHLLTSLFGIHGTCTLKKSRTLRAGEKIIGPVQQGPRGGYFFIAKGVKIYIPKGQGNLEYAKKKWGSTF